jgi:hypothetical protein
MNELPSNATAGMKGALASRVGPSIDALRSPARGLVGSELSRTPSRCRTCFQTGLWADMSRKGLGYAELR